MKDCDRPPRGNNQAPAAVSAIARTLALAGVMIVLLSACGGATPPAAAPNASAPSAAAPGAAIETQATPVEALPADIIVYASDLPQSALTDELAFWDDPASPGGKMIGIPNTGDELDPPPENDPSVTFKVGAQPGIPYRCWIHMKVGEPKGVSQANMFWVQFSDAVDGQKQEVYRPDTGSYLTAQGPEQEGWTWVGCDPADGLSSPLVYFGTGGQVTVRLQAGMEGVGFDQFVLSPARFLDKAPSEAVVEK